MAKRNWREDDRLFSIFTSEFGKIEAAAVGSRKIMSKLAGHLVGGGIIELDFVRGRSVNKIIHAYLIKNFALKNEADFLCLQCLWEIMDKTLPVGEVNKEIWKTLNWAMEKILAYPQLEEKRLVINLFILKILPILGYRISWEQKWLYAHRFSFSDEMKELIHRLQVKGDFSDVKLSKNDNKKLFNFLAKYLNYYFEKNFNSFSFLM